MASSGLVFLAVATVPMFEISVFDETPAAVARTSAIDSALLVGTWPEDPATANLRIARLSASGAAILPPDASLLSEAEMVRAIQERLVALGYDAGPVDGMYGPQTAQAIAAYQRVSALAESGEPSAALLRHLSGPLAPAAAAP
jgi:peptidoglycan hydrolase-like protein with peptidoglycan-binding domain